MKYNFQFKRYQRKFREVLKTSGKVWTEREGILVRMEDVEGKVSFGEIAPIPEFGTESVLEAETFCRSLNGSVVGEEIKRIPKNLRCCRFALSTAASRRLKKKRRRLTVAALLPAGTRALQKANDYLKAGYTRFKWKMGVGDVDEEREVFKELAEKVPGTGALRLDANGGLSRAGAETWLRFLEDYAIEFIEQPMPKGEESGMMELAKEFKTPIALDESVCGVEELSAVVDKGWQGPLVVKPSLLGDREDFILWREESACPLIYSSAFETAVGIEAGLELAAGDLRNGHAVGYGTLDYLAEDGLTLHKMEPAMDSGIVTINDLEALWKKAR